MICCMLISNILHYDYKFQGNLKNSVEMTFEESKFLRKI